MPIRHLSTRPEEYAVISTRASAYFDLSSRFPNNVFNRPCHRAIFIEYEWALGGDFWPALSSLASIHGDRQVEFLVLEPDPSEYYNKEYGSYASFSLDVTAPDAEYWEALTEVAHGDETGAIAFSANVIAITGESADWGCWGERYIGVATIQSAQSSKTDEWLAQYGPFWSADEALGYPIASNFNASGVPQEFASMFRENYKDRVDNE